MRCTIHQWMSIFVIMPESQLPQSNPTSFPLPATPPYLSDMETSLKSSSNGASSSNTARKKLWGPKCHYGRDTKPTIAWTDENPGRRFHRCPEHGFNGWIDMEKSVWWQTASLIEARNEIRLLEAEIRGLKSKLQHFLAPHINYNVLQENKTDDSQVVASEIEDVLSLRVELIRLRERETLLREIFYFVLGGFLVATGIILSLLK